MRISIGVGVCMLVTGFAAVASYDMMMRATKENAECQMTKAIFDGLYENVKRRQESNDKQAVVMQRLLEELYAANPCASPQQLDPIVPPLADERRCKPFNGAWLCDAIGK